MTQINALRRRGVQAVRRMARKPCEAESFRTARRGDERADASGRTRRPASPDDEPSSFGLMRRSLLVRGGRAALLATSSLVMNMPPIAFADPDDTRREIALPDPDTTGRMTLEAALAKRRSIREFSRGSLSPAEISQLLWAGQGITSPSAFRTAPSAGALYPLDLAIAIGCAGSLPQGVFEYEPGKHMLRRVASGDRREQVSRAALSQAWIADCAAVIAVTATMHRTTRKYGERGVRYAHMEAGHVAQNICLQAAALDLAVTPVGAFHDEEIREVLEMPSEAEPLYLLPIGRR